MHSMAHQQQQQQLTCCHWGCYRERRQPRLANRRDRLLRRMAQIPRRGFGVLVVVTTRAPLYRATFPPSESPQLQEEPLKKQKLKSPFPAFTLGGNSTRFISTSFVPPTIFRHWDQECTFNFRPVNLPFAGDSWTPHYRQACGVFP